MRASLVCAQQLPRFGSGAGGRRGRVRKWFGVVMVRLERLSGQWLGLLGVRCGCPHRARPAPAPVPHHYRLSRPKKSHGRAPLRTRSLYLAFAQTAIGSAIPPTSSIDSAPRHLIFSAFSPCVASATSPGLFSSGTPCPSPFWAFSAPPPSAVPLSCSLSPHVAKRDAYYF